VQQQDEAGADRGEVGIVGPGRVGHRQVLDEAGEVEGLAGQVRVVEGTDRDRHPRT
jgi:predicted ThiF/HesA family dinucleotide-utilizing enzyme